MDGGSLRRSHLAFVGCAPLVAIHDCFILAARLRRERIVVLISILVRGAEPLVSPSHPVLRVWKSTYRSIPGSTGFIDCFPSRIIPHCCGPGGQRGHFDCFLEFGLAKRFADYYRILIQPDPFSVAGEEYMRYRSAPEYHFYRGDAASLAQARIDDHQVQLVMKRPDSQPLARCHRCADLIAHTRQRSFPSSMAIRGVIFGYAPMLSGAHASHPERKRNPKFRREITTTAVLRSFSRP